MRFCDAVTDKNWSTWRDGLKHLDLITSKRMRKTLSTVHETFHGRYNGFDMTASALVLNKMEESLSSKAPANVMFVNFSFGTFLKASVHAMLQNGSVCSVDDDKVIQMTPLGRKDFLGAQSCTRDKRLLKTKPYDIIFASYLGEQLDGEPVQFMLKLGGRLFYGLRTEDDTQIHMLRRDADGGFSNCGYIGLSLKTIELHVRAHPLQITHNTCLEDLLRTYGSLKMEPVFDWINFSLKSPNSSHTTGHCSYNRENINNCASYAIPKMDFPVDPFSSSYFTQPNKRLSKMACSEPVAQFNTFDSHAKQVKSPQLQSSSLFGAEQAPMATDCGAIKPPEKTALSTASKPSEPTNMETTPSLQPSSFLDSHSLEPMLREFECPSCLDLLVPPTTQCSNGHLVCFNCRPSLKQCPLCASEFLQVKNTVVDNIVSHFMPQCKGVKYGCKTSGKDGLIQVHEDNCDFNKIVKCDITECMQKIAVSGYLVHVDSHIALFARHEFPMKIEFSKFIKETPKSSSLVLLIDSTFQHKFACHFIIDSDSLYVAVRYLGDRRKLFLFSVNVSLSDGSEYVVTTKPPLMYDLFEERDLKSFCHFQLKIENLKNKKGVFVFECVIDKETKLESTKSEDVTVVHE